ncbi:MAG TPA: bifunctional phosphoribosylaminoimidazolecarboxamide formyltransferase/IMP cyclohydrolase [Roseiflexaceae bacterium]|nr:bifunctional phosphoribosylaminoimidazolecarboxamide formyltransferase/IMP cyclohydrolase [Roseiflexaceae bacterium]
MRALISVSDKQGLDAFAAGLRDQGVEIFSTGNTARFLGEQGVPVRSVSELTGFPEILDGRVKTLHPAVHGGILARRDLPDHMDALAAHGIGPIDLVVVNLYPFAATIARPDVTLEQALEQIDIGGPAMVRASAKNHPHVLIVVDPADYPVVLQALREGALSPDLRRRLAAKAFAHTAAYDAAIAAYLSDEPYPATMPVAFPKAQDLRYGENPHQSGALYGDFGQFFEHLHGKELSYINILDIAAAQELIEEFPPAEQAALAILKHTNPCGVGAGASLLEAWERAFATDREAPFGGIIVVNRPLDQELARAIDEIFSEIVIAPAFEPDALDLLRRKKNRRLMRSLRPVAAERGALLHSVPGGVLVQQPDRAPLAEEEQRVVTQRAPTEQEWQALRFAWRVAKHVKSNAIVYTGTAQTLGIGAGQMSRVDSARLAIWKAERAGLSLEGSALASDAFFPFSDSLEAAAAAGATAVIQPGGSVRDNEVIAAADRLGLAMVCTGRRHFRH